MGVAYGTVSDKQYRHAVRAREIFLVGWIREFVQIGDEEAAAQAERDMLTKAMLFTDAVDWIWINKRWQRRRQPREQNHAVCARFACNQTEPKGLVAYSTVSKRIDPKP